MRPGTTMRRARRVTTALVLAVSTSAWAPPVTAQTRQGLLSLPDARLFYEVVGSGPPIVVVHGGPGLDHNYLRPGLDVLAAGHTLVYYDQRGTGRSDAALDSVGINLDAFVGDIDALRQALGYEKITVLGHSFGGLIALAYVRVHPASTEALILMDTVEPGRRWRTQAARRAAAARTPEDSAELAVLTASQGYEDRDPATMSAVYRVAFRSTMRVPDNVSKLNLDLSARTAKNGPEVQRLLGGELKDVDWWDSLGAVDVPTLVIQGRYDATPVAMARALADSLPRGQLVVLPTGHFPYVEDPGGLVEAVSGFLAGLQR